MCMPRQWANLRKILERRGPFSHPDFEPSPENLDFLMNTCQILVVGAGGLGCELLKNLALMGFRQLHIIDMDTVELSNLNRQFLFRLNDIGKSKAEVAASFVNNRITGCHIQPHFCRLENFDQQFYKQFHIIVCGLDSIPARRWINAMLVSNLIYNDDGSLNYQSITPLVDGGTEGFKGNVRVILPGITACIECTIDLYPPQINYPLCTIANTPRLPEHCVEYVKVIQWPKENPFACDLDTDDPNHINWIFEKAIEYANKYHISGITYRLVQGVVKNIIPTVASTNAIIASLCCNEVFKLATNCFTPLNNYMIFNDLDGIYTYSYQAEKKSDCLVCATNQIRILEINNAKNTKLKHVIEMLKEKRTFQLQSPGLTAIINGHHKTLYMPNTAAIEQATRTNLDKTLTELDLEDGTNIMVFDVTIPNHIIIKLKFVNDLMQISVA